MPRCGALKQWEQRSCFSLRYVQLVALISHRRLKLELDAVLRKELAHC
jgi:hypothetical protein